jgi:malonyl CoA-acyl carrier protein transacylase
MGAVAMLAFPSFRETIQMLDMVLDKLEPKPAFNLEEVLLRQAHSDRFNDAEISQPLCTAIQIALIDLFAQWGIKPVVSVGHSSGEIGAAVCHFDSSMNHSCPFLSFFMLL